MDEAKHSLILAATKLKPPKAMTEAPRRGAIYWTPVFHSYRMVDDRAWNGLAPEICLLKNNMCYATRVDAKTVADAMLALVRA